ncbi:MAG: hypothetical protein ACYC3S_01265 [Chloroflexota bacterium]
MDALEQLRLFLVRANALLDTRLVRQYLPHSMSIKFHYRVGLWIEESYPDEDDLRALLTHIRPFMMERESIYLNRIYNLCHLRLTSDELKGYLIESRKRWLAAFKRGGFGLQVDDKEYTPELVMDLWINGHFFHNDEEKLRALQKLAPVGIIFARQQFLFFLGEAVEQTLFVAGIVNMAFTDGLVR